MENKKKKTALAGGQNGSTQTNNNRNIKYKKILKRVPDYSGLEYGASDIDTITEYKGVACVIGELKFGDAPIPTGQRLMLERTVNAYCSAGVDAIAAKIAYSSTGDVIDVANSVVTSWYYNREWRTPTTDQPPVTYGRFQASFIRRAMGEHYSGGEA